MDTQNIHAQIWCGSIENLITEIDISFKIQKSMGCKKKDAVNGECMHR